MEFQSLRILLLMIAVLSSLAVPAAAQPRGGNNIALSVAVESAVPVPGRKTRIALTMTPRPGWHGYWLNPGDSGLPPRVEWTAPEGTTFGPLRHPTPTLLELAGLASYVHAGEHSLVTEMTLPQAIPAGTAVPLVARIDWLACSDTLCVPETRTIRLDLVAGDGAPAADARRILARAEQAMPERLPAVASLEVASERLRVVVPVPAHFRPERARLFPMTEGLFEAAAPQAVRETDAGLEFTIPLASASPPQALAAVVTDGAKSYALRAEVPPRTAGEQAAPLSAPQQQGAQAAAGGGRNAAPVGGDAASLQPQPAPGGGGTGFLAALLAAVVGGLILNVMPCVFPILSLKALSLARTGQSEAAARTDALAYAAGTIFVCLSLGAALVALRALGAEVGWAFQLQDPRVVLALLVLVTAIGLNLAGLFELPAISIAAGASSGSGPLPAFSTGALSAFVATPCSGPFMATALGAALLLPVPAALAVFGGLGLGLALPFLLVGFVPALRRRLPRPGPWMATFRHLLSLPMFATALGLAWVLGRQTGVDGMALGLALALLAAASLWWVGVRQRRGRAWSWLPLVPLAAVAALVVLDLPIRAAAPTMAAQPLREPFSADRLAELRAQGVPVFVDFTADWCLTCKVNERLAIDRAETRAAFGQAGVVTLVGDWTRGDQGITRFLQSHGRNSIPYYLFYRPGEEPQELPQILTTGLLRNLAEDSGSVGLAGM